jgi:hypothetical protein
MLTVIDEFAGGGIEKRTGSAPKLFSTFQQRDSLAGFSQSLGSG